MRLLRRPLLVHSHTCRKSVRIAPRYTEMPTFKSSLTTRGALIEATLPVVISKTCTKPGNRADDVLNSTRSEALMVVAC